MSPLRKSKILSEFLPFSHLNWPGCLCFFGLTSNMQHLHPVQKCRGYGCQGVGRGDEEYLGEVEGHVEVVVCEAVVLLRV